MNRIRRPRARSKALLLACALLCLLLTASGCSRFIPVPAENLVRPPRVGGTNALLEEAFEKHMQQGEYVLRYPASGPNRTAYVRSDLDGDGLDEALVFYSLRSEEMVVRMCMMDYDGETWTAAKDVVGDGADVYSVEFLDMDGNGASEILVGWSSLDSKSNKNLTVYGTEPGRFAYEAMGLESFTDLYAVDIDGDEQTELLLTLVTSGADKYAVDCKLLKLRAGASGSSLELRGQTELYSQTVSFEGFRSEKADDAVRVYIDENAGSTHLTEIVYWDAYNNALAKALTLDPTTLSSSPVARSLPLLSLDVDGDGRIEVPSTTLLEGSRIELHDDNIEDERVYAVRWSRYTGDGFEPVETYVENPYGEYRFALSDDDLDRYVITIDSDTGLMRFDASGNGKTLFYIITGETGSFPPGSRVIKTEENRVWACQISDEGASCAIDRDYIAERFSRIETEERVTLP